MWLYYLLIGLSSIALHELGHWIVLNRYVRSGRIEPFYQNWHRWGIRVVGGKEVWVMTRQQKRYWYIGGIVLGFLPLLFLPKWPFLIANVLYFWGCKKDVRSTISLLD